MANISYRLGRQSPPETIRAAIKDNHDLSDAFGRCCGYLKENGIDLAAAPATLGPWVNYDAGQERFIGDFAEEAEKLVEKARVGIESEKRKALSEIREQVTMLSVEIASKLLGEKLKQSGEQEKLIDSYLKEIDFNKN